MLKQVQILNMRENKQLGTQYFEIHEVDPTYKIDRIVYREKSRTGWFKELSAEVFKEKTQHLQSQSQCPPSDPYSPPLSSSRVPSRHGRD